jgi:hypothetical protein
MGYNTSYELTVDYTKGQAEREKAKETEIQEIKDSNLSEKTKQRLISDITKEYQNHYVTESDVVAHIGHNPFNDSCKWYDHDEDMISVFFLVMARKVEICGKSIFIMDKCKLLW